MSLWLTLNTGLLIMAYLLGSIPTGYIVARTTLGIDIREVGSGSTGATNILRTLGKAPALFVLFVDLLKGLGAIELVYLVYNLDFTKELAQTTGLNIGASLPWAIIMAGLMAILGHSKSIWLGFTGGKSVATSLGVLLGMSWPLGLATLGIFGLSLAISRIVSLSSIIGAIGLSLLMFVTGQNLAYQIFGLLGGVYVIWRHQNNIQRILNGTEPRLGEKLPPATEINNQLVDS